MEITGDQSAKSENSTDMGVAAEQSVASEAITEMAAGVQPSETADANPQSKTLKVEEAVEEAKPTGAELKGKWISVEYDNPPSGTAGAYPRPSA